MCLLPELGLDRAGKLGVSIVSSYIPTLQNSKGTTLSVCHRHAGLHLQLSFPVPAYQFLQLIKSSSANYSIRCLLSIRLSTWIPDAESFCWFRNQIVVLLCHSPTGPRCWIRWTYPAFCPWKTACLHLPLQVRNDDLRAANHFSMLHTNSNW
jgi:hypothetical protein